MTGIIIRTTVLLSLIILFSLTIPLAADERGSSAPPIPGVLTQWNGFARYDFVLDSRDCVIVAPQTPAAGRPWIWRARFFGHRPEVDIALLNEGFYLVYMDAADLYGSPKAVEHWNQFYRYLTLAHGFHPKAVLEGMSRGGLIIYNWAAANPDKTTCIYADAPVCDFKSWPGGKGKGKGSPGDWQKCLKAYGLTEEQAMQYSHNPIDNLAPLAKARVPLLHVHGDADDVVPLEENTRILEARYRQLGGSIQVIVKNGVGHKHGLEDPAPIVDFILKSCNPSTP
ncbi:MAG: prolyl oligopeptidase family serine peptidase [Candidatus Omnitrophica bacterium]|nr:prolyl oligopeptidase family serine peptidase [Candidatus Omnitrophota bacterium]